MASLSPSLRPGRRSKPKPPPVRPKARPARREACVCPEPPGPSPSPGTPGAPEARPEAPEVRRSYDRLANLKGRRHEKGREGQPRAAEDLARKGARPATGDDRSPIARTRISNHSDLLPGLDGRSIPARRFRDITFAIIADQGGMDLISEARLQLIRRFSAAAVIAELLEAKFLDGGQINTAEHALCCSTLVRTASKIGIGRRAKNITPSLADILNPPIAQVEPLPDGEPIPNSESEIPDSKPITDPIELAEREAARDDDE